MKILLLAVLAMCPIVGQYLPLAGGGSGSSGGLVLVEEHTASSSATINFTSCITSTYDNYQIQIVNAQAATDSANMLLLVSTNAGSTWAGSAYYWAFQYSGPSGPGSHQNASDSSIEMADGISNASTASISRTIYIYSPLSAALWKQFTWTGVNDGAGPASYAITGFGEWQSATAINAVQFKMSSGNIASGNFRCYGISK